MKIVKTYLFDLDHTLYRDPANKNTLYRHAAIMAAKSLGLCQDFQSAACAVDSSISTYRSEIQGLIQDWGGDRAQVFQEYHEKAVPLFLPHVAPLAGAREALVEAKTAGVRLGVITHSARQWAEPFLSHLGLSGVFEAADVFCLNDAEVAFRQKNEGPEVFEHVCQSMRIDPQKAVFFDDSIGNLKHPRDMGMETTLITWGAKNPKKADWVTHYSPTIVDALKL